MSRFLIALLLTLGHAQTKLVGPQKLVGPVTIPAACALPYTDNFAGSGSVNSAIWSINNPAFVSTFLPVQVSGTATWLTDSQIAAAEVSGCAGFNPAAETIQAPIFFSNDNAFVGLAINAEPVGGNSILFIIHANGGSPTTAIYETPSYTNTSCGVTPVSGHTYKLSNVGTAYTVVDVTTSTTICSQTIAGYDTTGTPAIYINQSSTLVGAVGPVTFD